MNKIPRVMVAMVTPFNEFNLIDYKACSKLIEHFINEQVEGIVVCGTTGECATLSNKEKMDLLRFIVSVVNKRIPVWMGCGTNDTLATLQLAQNAAKEAIDGLMLITPYYNRPSQDGMYAHFKKIADNIDLPIMLYNVPKRTGVHLMSSTVIRLCKDCPNIIALKQASDDLEDTKIILSESDCIVVSGDDGLFKEGLELGMEGIVSVVGHLYAPLLHQVIKHHEFGLDDRYDVLLKRITKACFMVSSPSDIKYLLAKNQLCNEQVRLPLVTLNSEQKNQLDVMLQRIQQNLPG